MAASIERGAGRSATSTPVPGLLLRPARWPEEAPILMEINNAGRLAGGQLGLLSLDGFVNYYAHLLHCDLSTDLRLAEHDGRAVGYARVDWDDEVRGDRAHVQGLFVRPDAPEGTFEAMLEWTEARTGAVATTLPDDRPAVIGAFMSLETPAFRAVLEDRGYRAVRFFFTMLRPTLDEIPDLPPPDGVDVRPVEPSHVRAIFDAEVAAFHEHWGASLDDDSESRWEGFRDEPLNDLSLWQVAWAGDVVIGQVRPFINAADLAAFGVQRGWCENISTHADWRGRGVAKALIARALAALRDRGMTEAALTVDAENATGAVQLYRAMGFSERRRETDYRRPLIREARR